MHFDGFATRLHLIAEGKRLEQENSDLRAASHPFGAFAESFWLRLKAERQASVADRRQSEPKRTSLPD